MTQRKPGTSKGAPRKIARKGTIVWVQLAQRRSEGSELADKVGRADKIKTLGDDDDIADLCQKLIEDDSPFDVSGVKSSMLQVYYRLGEDGKLDEPIEADEPLGKLLAQDRGTGVKTALIVVMPPLPSATGGKRSLEGENVFSKKTKFVHSWDSKKEWFVNGSIGSRDRGSVYYVDPADNEETKTFFNNIIKGEYLLLMGARASGKTTRLFRLGDALIDAGYIPIYVNLGRVETKGSLSEFWSTFIDSLNLEANSQYTVPADAQESPNSIPDFAKVFKKNRWERDVVLFIDEYDLLDQSTEEVRTGYLKVARAIRDERNFKQSVTAIQSIVAAGTFSIRHLNTKDIRVSPFNVTLALSNPYFTEEQVTKLFDEFAATEKIIIDPAVVKDIYDGANGHPGLVCLCGRIIQSNIGIFRDSNRSLHLEYDKWVDFSAESLPAYITSYPTFGRMKTSLLLQESGEALDLLRTWFLGSSNKVSRFRASDEPLIKFLVAEGVLLEHNAVNKIYDFRTNSYTISSPIIDIVIRQDVIPRKYPAKPDQPIPREICQLGTFWRRRLDIMPVLKIAVKIFDREFLERAADRSYKKAHVKVDGFLSKQVPRESAYELEMARILKNWFGASGYTITTRWHCRTHLEDHDYPDIVITHQGEQSTVIELLCTPTEKEVKDHIKETCNRYMPILEAEVGWVVNFTREDNYLNKPYWQSATQRKNGLNVVHFWHNQDFTNVKMSARWTDINGANCEIKNEPIIMPMEP